MLRSPERRHVTAPNHGGRASERSSSIDSPTRAALAIAAVVVAVAALTWGARPRG